MINSAYHLPWTESDNPNGWIEPTTLCNIKCPGCYRGADKEGHKGKHMPLDELQKQIDWFIKNRNIHTLSISGGEPLLYPELIDLIKYAASKKLRIMLYTNGLSLTDKFLGELRDAGVTQFLIHIDRFQIRPGEQSLLQANEIRLLYCEMFRRVGNIMMGFIQPINIPCECDIKNVLDISKQNCDVVSLIVFTLYKEICWDKSTQNKIDTNLTMDSSIEALKHIDNFIPAAYLASEHHPNEASWVFGNRMLNSKKILSYISPSFYAFSHKTYRKRNNKHLFISRKHHIKFTHLFKLIYFAEIRKTIAKHLSSFLLFCNKKIYFQTILLLRGPDKKDNQWELCESCPDRIIHQGKLIPSCILDDLKEKENTEFKTVHFDESK